jgi:hypothetical protein
MLRCLQAKDLMISQILRKERVKQANLQAQANTASKIKRLVKTVSLLVLEVKISNQQFSSNYQVQVATIP